MISVKNVSFSYNNVLALNNVSLDLPAGKLYAIIGPNGSGKTTLMKLMAGLLTPNLGEIAVFHKNPAKLSGDELRKIGYEPQELGLYEDLSVLDNMRFYARLYQVPHYPKRVKHLLKLLEMESYQKKKISQLSGGMKKKASFAIAFIHKPRIVFLDEPTAAIDPILRQKLLDHIKKYLKEGRTVIMTTHQFDEASKADEIILLHSGKVILQKPISYFRNEHKSIEEIFIEKLKP